MAQRPTIAAKANPLKHLPTAMDDDHDDASMAPAPWGRTPDLNVPGTAKAFLAQTPFVV